MDDDEWDEELYKWQYVDDYYAHLTGLNALHDVEVKVPWNSEADVGFLTVITFVHHLLYIQRIDVPN